MTQLPDTNIVEAKQDEVETIEYFVQCPECSEYFEDGSSMIGQVLDCICGAKVKVVK